MRGGAGVKDLRGLLKTASIPVRVEAFAGGRRKTGLEGPALKGFVKVTQVIMRQGFRQSVLCVVMGLTAFSLGAPWASAVVVTVDILPTYNTIVLRDCNGSDRPHTYLSANTTTPPGVPSWLGNSGGVASYAVPAGSNDPRWEFFHTATYDVHQYPYVRARLSSGNTSTIEAWPRTPVGATTVRLGTGSGNANTFAEYRSAWKNPNDPSIVTATQGGFRIDMVSGNSSASEITTALDYFMVDTSQTVGFEFDRVGDFQGCTLGNVLAGSPSVAGSFLSATLNSSGSTDANLYVPVNLDTNVFDYVEIRMRQSEGTFNEVFFGTTTQGGLSESRKVTFGIADGQFHTYLLDFSADPRWDGTLNSFRLDPGNGRLNTTFDVDYIRFRDFAFVPEPATLVLLLLGLASIALVQVRRT